eukprot:gene29997-33883_t
MLRSDYPGKEFNIEGYPSPDFLALVEKARPDQVTLVPDDPNQSTSDHGWDTVAQADFLRAVISRLKAGNMRVSVFIDADPAAAHGAAALNADRIELYTGPYGHTFVAHRKAEQLDALVRAADAARADGLGINVDHDLTLDNLPPLLARIPGVAEASIGHALTADALIYGMAETKPLSAANEYTRRIGGLAATMTVTFCCIAATVANRVNHSRILRASTAKSAGFRALSSAMRYADLAMIVRIIPSKLHAQPFDLLPTPSSNRQRCSPHMSLPAVSGQRSSLTALLSRVNLTALAFVVLLVAGLMPVLLVRVAPLADF